MHENPSDDVLRDLLTSANTIAVVGASSDPERSSYGIMRRLQQVGYRVIPVNPNEREVLGERAYPSLDDVPVPIDIVTVFRRAVHAPPIADQAVRIKARALWLQSGITSEEAAARAGRGGLSVVMDACIGVTHRLLGVPLRSGSPAPCRSSSKGAKPWSSAWRRRSPNWTRQRARRARPR